MVYDNIVHVVVFIDRQILWHILFVKGLKILNLPQPEFLLSKDADRTFEY